MTIVGGFMRKLFIILVSLIALATFIRAFDNTGSEKIEIPVENTGVIDSHNKS
jgi:hypothetical protein